MGDGNVFNPLSWVGIKSDPSPAEKFAATAEPALNTATEIIKEEAVKQNDAATKKKLDEDAAATAQTKDSARRRQEQRSRRSQGRAGTLLTGPLGLSNEPDIARKTILGG